MKVFSIALLVVIGAYGYGTLAKSPCPSTGLYGTPYCCQTDVLGLTGIDCETPPTPVDASNFRETCERKGIQSRCCASNRSSSRKVLLCIKGPV
ncbi:trihydrophobin-like [Bradysia coprophila]|uniref:trihydrophobin-like n=1 Tax=Bradysia coprophila TaxID=38358 RepID=UPI00187D7363|nr:trihydrophobin-like [Bradysia coprophila]